VATGRSLAWLYWDRDPPVACRLSPVAREVVAMPVLKRVDPVARQILVDRTVFARAALLSPATAPAKQIRPPLSGGPG